MTGQHVRCGDLGDTPPGRFGTLTTRAQVVLRGPPRATKNAFYSATTFSGSTAFPFVISTAAQRSGEISEWMLSLGNVFLTKASWARGPTEGRRKTASIQQLVFLEAPPSPLSSRPKRSIVERSLSGYSLLGKFFRTRDHGARGPTEGRRKTASIQQLLFLEAPPSPLSSRPKRSVVERSAVFPSTHPPSKL